MIRTGALWICALQTIEENRGKSNREKLTVAELVRQTRKRLRSGITLETPGGTSELGDEIAQSEKFFESILTDSDWLTSNFGDMDAGLFFDLEQTDSIISSGLVLPQDDSI
ncbi:DEKNAAC103667 [Brettanomyces naardenensis]|uniref:DEKNAAC103667 n=1 Tax=Brettanomyces naardenensis TaxID=13370 RepID=A0A448YNU2_BRENA|nr:DEKNAAC103667 [Brettanomyces naardenensis]